MKSCLITSVGEERGSPGGEGAIEKNQGNSVRRALLEIKLLMMHIH